MQVGIGPERVFVEYEKMIEHDMIDNPEE